MPESQLRHCRVGYTPPRSVPEHRELRRYFSRVLGCGAGLVTRTHGTYWLALRWGQGLRAVIARPTTVEEWQDWALRTAAVCSSVRSARKGIEHAMEDYRRMEQQLAGAVEDRDRYREALDKLDGKVEAGWRQSLITSARRPGGGQ